MRLAVYNVENLFDRAKAMNLETWDEGRPILEAFAELGALLGEVTYTPADRQRMIVLFEKLGLEKSDTGPFVILRRNRGGLVRRPRAGGIEITADGRADWIGSLELRDEPINEHAIRNTARGIRDLQADVLGVVEAENRPALAAFNKEIMPLVQGFPFRHVMVIDGNDARGIDDGLMTGRDFPIGLMRSHVDDRLANGGTVFSRDCPEFYIETPNGNRVMILLNHLKSKGYGGTAASNARRRAQAERVKTIYDGLSAAGEKYVAVMGDLNDVPGSDPLRPLVGGTDLTDVFAHPAFDDGGYPGTYGLCNAANKIDYVLLSPDLFGRVRSAGVHRADMWPGSRPRRWDAYPEVRNARDAASDHAAVWADLDV